MEPTWKSAVWSQFGAAIDMLENAVHACPDELWNDRTQRLEFWYVVYHALFWLDLYLSGTAEGFAPPAPFTLDELDPAGVLPAQAYTKEELLRYLAYTREKCHATLSALTDERARQPIAFPWSRGKDWSFVELQLYNMRHVQEHASQLLLLLGQHDIHASANWVARA